jgi:hypothetical protein
VKDQLRFPLDHHDNCTFAVSMDWDAAQITLEGPPTGPGGGASLTFVPGVELVFDRAEGRLSQVVVDAGERFGPVVPREPALAYLGRVLGDPVAAALRQAPYRTVPSVTLRPHPTAIATLSRLARLDCARQTTPVPWSPLWELEAADLARKCQSRSTLAHVGPLLPSASAAPPPPATAPASKDLSGWLDPALVPPDIFHYSLSPDSDLDIRVHDDEEPLITIKAMLEPGASRSALASCQVRLVDSDAQRVLAVSPLRPDGLRAYAELPAPAAAGLLWVEVVDDERRPVRGTRLRRMRRALRWADAALRAASRPVGLDPDRTDEQWAGLAAMAWDRCCAHWTAAGDTDRAAVAAWIARHPIQWTRPYLAEATCGPAATRLSYAGSSTTTTTLRLSGEAPGATKLVAP